jgi:chaperonin GroES
MVPYLDHNMNNKESAIMATKFTPLHDRILVRRVEEAGTTRGGLIIPDSAKDKPQEGKVISVGEGKINDEGKLFPLAVKEGDSILFGKYSGTEIKLDGEDFLIMKEEEVLGVVTGTAKKETVSACETVGARK